METVFDFHQAYLEGITTPSQVAQRFLDVVRSMEESAVPLKPMVEWDSKEILKQAEISTNALKKENLWEFWTGFRLLSKMKLIFCLINHGRDQIFTKTTPLQDSTAVSRLRRAGLDGWKKQHA